MAEGRYDSSLTRLQPLFGALFANDRWGRAWLPGLLAAAPRGPARLGSMLDEPGTLLNLLAVQTARGRLGCFEYRSAPPRELLSWFIEHPNELIWPASITLSAETVRLRRALIEDQPAGSRAKAQARARKMADTRPPWSREWWRFENVTQLDCALITDRLVVTVKGVRTEPIGPATEWYPSRSALVAHLEAAHQLARGRQWGTILLSETLLPDGREDHLRDALPQAAPHLDPDQLAELDAGYLGNLTWSAACAAVGLPLDTLPNTTDDLLPDTTDDLLPDTTDDPRSTR